MLFIIAFGLWMLSVVWYGFIFRMLWLWFVTPTFHLDPLSLPVAMGIVLIISLLTTHYEGKTPPKEMWERIGNIALNVLFGPGLMLGAGWTLHYFFM